MKKILKPYWLFVCVTLPQIILAIVFFRMLNIIGSELSQSALHYWTVYSITLGALVLLFTGYALYKTVHKKDMTKLDIGILLVAYIAYVYALLYDLVRIIPNSIPQWMFFDMNPLLLISVCFMPVFMYCITSAVVLFAPKKSYKFWVDIIVMAAMPIGLYLFFQLLIVVDSFANLDVLFNSYIFPHIMIVVVIAATITFVFFMMRLMLHLFNKKKRSWRIASIIAAIVLPLAGLLLNQFVFDNLMGNFSSIYFYILLAINALLLLLPEFENLTVKIVLFALKSICYTYSLYFFVVFLPFIPLAMVLTIAMGLGFLLMSPTLLLVVHTRSLIEDFKSIQSTMQNKKSAYQLAIIFAACLLVVPSIMTLSFYRDRHTINTALEYVYEQSYDYSDTVKINQNSLKRTLTNLEDNTTNTRMVELYSNTPFIGSLYNKIVLDNATIGQSKINTLSKIFLGEEWEQSDQDWNWFVSQSIANDDFPEVVIKDYTVESVYDEELGYYTSWVHLDIHNTGNTGVQYFTEFTLPEGCYISDYYLYVNDDKKMGLITDKRAANWIYEQIVSIRRDPGILTYVKDDVINFRVFPFSKDEVRQTGIEFIHKQPVTLTMDDITMTLGNEAIPDDIVTLGQCITYIPPNKKSDYPEITRQPEYYFVVDASYHAQDKIDDYINTVNSFVDDNNIDTENITYCMTDYTVTVVNKDWQIDDYINHHDFSGGFFADRAVKMILYSHYMSLDNTYPVIILVTDDLSSAILLNDYDDLKFTIPDCEYIYQLNSNKDMRSASLIDETSQPATFADIKNQQKNVIAYPNSQNPAAYLSVDDQGAIVLTGQVEEDLLEQAENKWQSALVLDAMNMQLNLRTTQRNLQSLQIVIGSIESRVMTPLTSFIVLETEAQEKALLEKQEQLLKSGKMYLSDEPGDLEDMSEPSFWVLMLLVAAYVVYKRYRQHTKKIKS